MLFNSYEFIFGFLPVTLFGFWFLGARRRDWALLWLTAASLFFYAWWRPINVLLIAPSILINLGLARLLERYRVAEPARARVVLIRGIVFNLCFLGCFRYAMVLPGADLVLTHFILPLGISFITIQNIAFLADVRAGRVAAFTLREYALFVLFFPRLIAGPIVHYREMMPRFRTITARFDLEDTSVGVTLFFMGLAKKLLFADPLAPIVSPLYLRAAQGQGIGVVDAWIAAVGFLLQVYFDFSGYSDMALGLARLFGIKLPANFLSPLKASSIIEFWQRWNRTLTRFLTAYVCNPLTRHITRASPSAFIRVQIMPVMVTTLIFGVWHGAGYTFLVFGLMFGVYITINRAWRQFGSMPPLLGWAVTFLAVTLAIVMFRSPTVEGAILVWADMFGGHGVTLPEGLIARLGSVGAVLSSLGVRPDTTSGALLTEAAIRIVLLLGIVLGLPNTLRILARYEPAIGVRPAEREAWLVRFMRWTPYAAWAVGMAFVAAAGILSLGQLNEFVYWRF